MKGRLDEAHLGDHPAAIVALAEVLTEGTDPGELMILERIQVRHTPDACPLPCLPAPMVRFQRYQLTQISAFPSNPSAKKHGNLLLWWQVHMNTCK